MVSTDLSAGLVPEQADLLMVLDPEELDEKALFAVDQFLMKGGTVALATGPFAASLSQQSLVASQRTSGLEPWLEHLGLQLQPQMVMDPQNAAFPAPVTRQVGGFSFQELVMLDYPYFVDVRGDGLNDDAAVNAGLNQVTLSWASPISVTAGEGIGATTLLASSSGSWLSTNTDVLPRYDESGLSPFVPEGEQSPHALGVLLEGRFESFFAGKPSPLLEVGDEAEEPLDADTAESEATSETDAIAATLGTVSGTIERSPESARLIVYGSNDFLADQTLRMVGAADGMVYTNTVQMIGNVVDWTLEDQSLVGIRARGNFNRTLPSMTVEDQTTWEYANYFLALFGIVLVIFVFKMRASSLEAQHRRWLEGAA